MRPSPVVLFVYNRPDHTRKTLEALAAADLSEITDLFIFSDAPKDPSDTGQLQKVEETRSLIRQRKWCGSVNITEQTGNKGLADSIISGVTDIIHRYGTVIVLEDDIVIGKGFLRYMNQALELYKDDPAVMHISGYIYPYARSIRLKEDTLFLKVYSCWGWATWERAWKHFNPDIDFHLAQWNTPEKIDRLNLEGHADCYFQLRQNKEGIIYSWAVKWYSSWLAKGGISLFPRESLVRNIGNDATGIHSAATNAFDTKTTDYLEVARIPVAENDKVRKSIDEFYKRLYHLVPMKPRFNKLIKTLILYKYWSNQ